MIEITFDGKVPEGLKPGRVQWVLRRSGADGIRAARADFKRRVRARKRIKAQYLQNKLLQLSYPRAGTPVGKMLWSLRVSAGVVPLSKYPARQTAKGVSVEVNRGKRVLIRGAFLARMKNGHRGVFKRIGSKRLPIDHVLSSSVADVARDEDLTAATLGRGSEVMRRTFIRLIAVELSR